MSEYILNTIAVGFLIWAAWFAVTNDTPDTPTRVPVEIANQYDGSAEPTNPDVPALPDTDRASD